MKNLWYAKIQVQLMKRKRFLILCLVFSHHLCFEIIAFQRHFICLREWLGSVRANFSDLWKTELCPYSFLTPTFIAERAEQYSKLRAYSKVLEMYRLQIRHTLGQVLELSGKWFQASYSVCLNFHFLSSEMEIIVQPHSGLWGWSEPARKHVVHRL